jgi:hypothetical protein
MKEFAKNFVLDFRVRDFIVPVVTVVVIIAIVLS